MCTGLHLEQLGAHGGSNLAAKFIHCFRSCLGQDVPWHLPGCKHRCRLSGDGQVIIRAECCHEKPKLVTRGSPTALLCPAKLCGSPDRLGVIAACSLYTLGLTNRMQWMPSGGRGIWTLWTSPCQRWSLQIMMPCTVRQSVINRGCPRLWYPKTALTPRFREPFVPQQNRSWNYDQAFVLFLSV